MYQDKSRSNKMVATDHSNIAVPCSKCGINDCRTRQRAWIGCDSCLSWFHITCVKISRRNAEALQTWNGPCCTPSTFPPPPAANSSSQPAATPTSGDDQVFDFTKHSGKRILKRIPKASRSHAAKLFTTLVNAVVSENSLQSWNRLLQFASRCLVSPGRAGKNHKSLATVVNKQLREFESNTSPPDTKSEAKPRNAKKPSIANIVSGKISDGDIRGAVRILASDARVLDSSPEVLEALKAKHPPPHEDTQLPAPPSDECRSRSYTISGACVKKNIRSFPKGSGGGPDGLAPQHLKDMISEVNGETSLKLVEALTRLMNEVILKGKVPDPVLPFFFGANLTALSKSDGGVRPIACGNTLRRLAGKLCMSKLSESTSQVFRPHQMGVGVQCGAEAAAHSCRRYIENPQSQNKIMLKVDFRNAFNTIRRDLVIREVERIAPEALPLVWQSYSQASYLFHGSDIVLSEEGVQQGDPLGPALFSLAIQSIVDRCQSEYNIWYLDDGTIAGEWNAVLDDFRMILAAERETGVCINPAKCELIIIDEENDHHRVITEEFRNIAPQIDLVNKEDLKMLGAPVLATSIDRILEEKLCDLRRMTTRLKEIDAHDALFLLRHCFALPKLMYFLRASPSYKSDILHRYDEEMKSSLEGIINTKLTDDGWKQSSLPVNRGGLGIRSAVDLALPAFIASTHATNMTVLNTLPTDYGNEPNHSLAEATLRWTQVTGITDPTWSSEQAVWDEPIVSAKLNEVMRGAQDETSRARILAASFEHSSHWLNAIPIASLGLKLDNSQLRISVGLRLGSPLCHPHQCKCGVRVSSDGIHGLSCKKSSGRFSRHGQINDIIHRSLTTAGIPTILEPVGVSRDDGKRPDGVSVFPWKKGKLLCWDYTCSDTLAPSHITASSRAAGRVAEQAENVKYNKYSVLQREYEVTPVCVETLGPWGPSGLSFIQEIGRRMKERTGEPRSTLFLMQSISVAVQRGNAASVMGTVQRSGDLEEIYYP